MLCLRLWRIVRYVLLRVVVCGGGERDGEMEKEQEFRKGREETFGLTCIWGDGVAVAFCNESG